MSATNAYNTNRLYWTTQFQQYIRFVLQGVQVTIDNTNRLYCRWFKLPPTIQTVCIVIDNTNRLYCSWLAIQTVCIVVGLQYKLFVLSAPQYKPFVLSSMQYKLFVLQLRATIQTVCIAGGSSYHTCLPAPPPPPPLYTSPALVPLLLLLSLPWYQYPVNVSLPALPLLLNLL